MKRFIATGLIALFGFGTVAPAALAKANEKNAHNLAIGTTAAAAYLLSQKKTRTLGLITAGGAALAWKKHDDAVKQRHKMAAHRAASARAHRRSRLARAHRASHTSYAR